METAKYIINKKKTEATFKQLNEPIALVLKDHQQETLDRAPRRRLLAFDTGTGKTIASISLVNKLKKQDTLLVVVPKKNVEQWAVELEKYLAKGVSATIISKEEFKAKVKELPYYDNLIVDEGHYFAGLTSALSKALFWYTKRHDPTNMYICTATPYCSTPWNIYTLAKHLGYNWNYSDFKNKFFNMINMGSRVVPVQRSGMENEVALLVKQIGDTVDINEIEEIPEQSEIVEVIPLTKEQEKAISESFDPLFLVRWTKQHQIENGFLYEKEVTETSVDGVIKRTFESHKTKRVLELVEEHKKIIIVARYTAQIELYQQLLEEKNKKVFVLSGKTKDAHAVVTQANESQECVFLMQASCSAGFELPTFDVMVFASMSFSYVDAKQARGRILRINHLHANKYIYLVSDGVDKDVFECIERKHDFTLKIYSK